MKEKQLALKAKFKIETKTYAQFKTFYTKQMFITHTKLFLLSGIFTNWILGQQRLG